MKLPFDPEKVLELYQAGVQFKSTINLFETVNKNERYFVGDQWNGSAAADLPKPVVNFLKNACQKKISNLASPHPKVVFNAIQYPDSIVTDGGKQQLVKDYGQNQSPELPGVLPSDGNLNQKCAELSQLLTAMFASDWERTGMDLKTLDGLQDACISGDMILYSYWDAAVDTGQAVKGAVGTELIDNVNYYPSNPNEPDPQKQPSIILARRELKQNVIAEATKNGVKAEDIQKISEDKDTTYQSGDMARNELQDNDNTKLITLLILWKDLQTGHVFAQKSTKSVVVRPQWDTRLTRYPVSMMNWERRKNCCHGRAEITGLTAAQRTVNSVLAFASLATLMNIAPKPLYNQSLIKSWSTKIGAAIPVNGDVNAAARYLQSPSISAEAFNLPQTIINLSMQMMGATDASMMSSSIRNMSALSYALNDIKAPLENVRQRFYAFLKEFALNWLDMTQAYLTQSRYVALKTQKGNTLVTAYDPEEVKAMLWDVGIDVGPASEWSEQTIVQTLNNLLNAGALTSETFIGAIPNDFMPESYKQMLLQGIQRQQMQQQAQQAQMQQAQQPTAPSQPGPDAADSPAQPVAYQQEIGKTSNMAVGPEQVMGQSEQKNK